MDAELILVRHGEAMSNAEGRFTTRTDVPLSPRGLRQAKDVAAALAGEPVAQVFTSPLERAAVTAAEIARAHPTQPQVAVDPRLTEIDAGPFEGLTVDEIMNGPLRRAYLAWHTDAEPAFPEGAETLDQACRRSSAFLAEVSRLPGRTVAVTHGSLARVMVTACVLGADPALHRRLWMDNGRQAIIRWRSAGPRLVGFNCPVPLRTGEVLV